MSRRENPAVIDAIARCDFDGSSQQTARAFGQLGDAPRLLQDILTIFDQRKVDRLRTSGLIESLSSIESHPWTGLSSGYLRDAQKLARLLRPLHIRPKTIRFMDRTAKGYERRGFKKAVIRIVEMVTAEGRQS